MRECSVCYILSPIPIINLVLLDHIIGVHFHFSELMSVARVMGANMVSPLIVFTTVCIHNAYIPRCLKILVYVYTALLFFIWKLSYFL